jgi:hypothetical protein
MRSVVVSRTSLARSNHFICGNRLPPAAPLPLGSPTKQCRLKHSLNKGPSASGPSQQRQPAPFRWPKGVPYKPLSILPLIAVLRSLGISNVSSSWLLPLALRIMTGVAHTTNPLLSADYNPILRYVLDKSLYAQFCAGDKASEVRATTAHLKSIGFNGCDSRLCQGVPNGSLN